MADLKPGVHQLYLRDEELRQGIELLFYAYRDFTAGPDAILAKLGFGRAHHRVIYFVGRYPGIRVGELLAILRITKQSLSRVLGQLLREGYVAHKPGPTDRRERRLELTPTGIELERQLTENQRARVAAAYRAAGAAAVEGYKKVLLGLIDETDRARASGTAPPPARGR
ncbi:MAG TPA: MarR family transcriptional regulator [Alphaproteobacteria bacterium]|nr:MarR family transcriptional regulator [Alphaproteobacteria bacterium]